MSFPGGDSRPRQVIIGSALVLALAVLICAALLGWRYVPGVPGEWLGMVVGLMSTPFLLEFSFIVIGLCLIVALNHWRIKRAGDDFVFLDQVDAPELAAPLPEHAAWAVLPADSPAGEEPSLLTQAEGAHAIGDHAMASELLASMDAAELARPETIALRVKIARATGRHDLARDLEARLHPHESPPPP